MDWDKYTAFIDTAILIWLVGWAILDRCNIYFFKGKS